tara:strand:+ start:128 stop:919 length:792 start_codon:yes stop_codon:yes gene_type:complete
MQLTDIGANLAHDSFDRDRGEVLARAQESGISRIIITGSNAQSNGIALSLAKTHPEFLYSTAGLHPHYANEYDQQLHESIHTMLIEPEVVAVGECGLDYFRNFSPKAAQRKAFEKQLDLAEESDLPIFLHQRDAHEDFVEILKPRLNHIKRGIAHCFTGTEVELEALLDLGLYIGITGWICDERRGVNLQNIVKLIPDDRLMIETDAPYLLPRSLLPKPKTRRNEPAYLREVLKMVAKCRQQTEEHVAKITSQVARDFFSLDH